MEPIDIEVIDAIDWLSHACYTNSFEHGFWDQYFDALNTLEKWGQIGGNDVRQYITDVKLSKIALMHSELGEMTEGIRKPCPDMHCPGFSSEEIQLADVLIRAFDYAGAYHLRLAAAVLAKMEYNKSRPYKHGKLA